MTDAFFKKEKEESLLNMHQIFSRKDNTEYTVRGGGEQAGCACARTPVHVCESFGRQVCWSEGVHHDF